MADPIAQFEIKPLIEFGSVGDFNFALTNSNLFMLIVVGSALAFFYAGGAGKLVPGRMQSIVEIFYESIADIVRQGAGEEGMRFFPLVITLFTFILFANMLGMFPYFFTITSHLSVTFALAMIVFLTVICYGVANHGLKFFGVFVPSGVPWPALILVVPIEIISFISRPISHSVRLFANMLAGHITLKIFAGFVISLSSFGALGVIASSLPLAMTVALTALEVLVAFLQAYVFAVLTCIYLNDALHPNH